MWYAFEIMKPLHMYTSIEQLSKCMGTVEYKFLFVEAGSYR